MLDLIPRFGMDGKISRHERTRLRRIIGIVLAAVAAIGLIALAAKYANAQALPLHVHERDEVTIKLMPGPCVDPTTVMLIAMNVPAELRDKFRAIESNWLMRNGSRRDYAGCWMEDGDDFLLIFSDATGTRINKARFNRRKGMVDS